MKPWWEVKHDWWVEDFMFEQSQKNQLCALLMKHPDDNIGNHLRDMIKMVDKKIKSMKVEYKKVYGRSFNFRRLEQ